MTPGVQRAAGLPSGVGEAPMRDAWELASFVVTTLALPFAIIFFAWEQRKERDNEEEEQYQLLSDAYNDFLKVVLGNPDLHLRTNEPLENPSGEQRERMLVIFDMLISLFERAYLCLLYTSPSPRD